MTVRFLGAVLLMGAGFGLFLQISCRRKKDIEWIEDLAAALEEMESVIRFRRMPLPDLLLIESSRMKCGTLFLSVWEHLERNIPLQDAWKKTMQEIHDNTVRECVVSLELGGDMQRITENLQYTAKRLRQILLQRLTDRHQQQKTTLALTISAFSLLVILLL